MTDRHAQVVIELWAGVCFCDSGDKWKDQC